MLFKEMHQHLNLLLETLSLIQNLSLAPPRGSDVTLERLDITRLALAVHASIVSLASHILENKHTAELGGPARAASRRTPPWTAPWG